MSVENKAKKKSKAHVRYKNKNGKIVPGVTTITGVLNKPALVKWANNLGLQGIDSSSYVDELAIIGTLAHYMIECYLKKEEPKLSEYSPDQIDAAENSVLKYYGWEEGHIVTPIGVEMRLVSEKHQFGGTIDLYCELDGVPTLIDFKTSKGIFPEHKIQVAAYSKLLKENGYPVEQVIVLRIGRDESEGFDAKHLGNQTVCWRIFKNAKAIYEDMKILNK